MAMAEPVSMVRRLRALGGRMYRGKIRRDVPILMFHRIRPGDGVTEIHLADILDHVAARYVSITLGELAQLLQRGGALPKNRIVLTFDDATLDQYALVAPALRKRGLRATFGVIGCVLTERVVPPLFSYLDLLEQTRETSVRFAFPTLVPEQTLRLDPGGREILASSKSPLRRLVQASEHTLAAELVAALSEAMNVRLPGVDDLFMTLEQIQSLVGQGDEAAGHSLRHQDVHEPDRQSWEQSLREEFALMNDCFGARPHPFIYPFGKERRPAVHAEVREAGFCCAATSASGTNTRRTSPFALRRVGINSDTPVPFATIY